MENLTAPLLSILPQLHHPLLSLNVCTESICYLSLFFLPALHVIFSSPRATSVFTEVHKFALVWLPVSQGCDCFKSSNITRCLLRLFKEMLTWNRDTDTPALVSLQWPSRDAKPLHLDWNKGRRKGACWWSIWQNRDASSVVNWLSHKRSLPWPINPDSGFEMTAVPPTPWWFLEGVWLALWHSGIIFLHPTSCVPGCIGMSSNYLVKMSSCQTL